MGCFSMLILLLPTGWSSCHILSLTLIITVFITWLNLELRIDVCYIDGMDIYIKTWIQLAFPIYIIFLVVLLIITSSYSSRFSKLIIKRNPVATLATLILISIRKTLSCCVVGSAILICSFNISRWNYRTSVAP